MLGRYWRTFHTWASQPHVRKWFTIILLGAGVGLSVAGLILFTVSTAGFGPLGVVGGSAAALFQATIYGAFTPAGGFFATMTSLAMTGAIKVIAALAGLFAAGGFYAAYFSKQGGDKPDAGMA
ncbi:hypothetical protein BDV93DRAFT_218142 [Ceratobasidium sp. AG-I]|nr:hypothetical protein BDV93DRAFT_218142 [Ceratobasidium sp. AG-I]